MLNLKTVLSGVSLSVMILSGGFARAETLEEALAYTYVANPDVLAKRAYLRSVYEKIAQSRSGYKPTIAGEAAYGYSYDRARYRPSFTESEDDPYNVGIRAVQPLFSGFETSSSVKVAEAGFAAEQAKLKATEQNVLVDAVSAYTNVIRDLAVVKLNQNNEAVLKRQLEYTRDRFRVGELTKTDVAQSEARLAGASASRIEAEGALKISYATYRQVIGKMPEKIYEPAVPESKLPQTLAEALEIAEKRNPQLKAAEMAAKSALSSIDVAKSGHYPTLNLQGTFFHNKAKTSIDGAFWNGRVDASDVQLVMNIPLYTAGNVSSKVRESKHLAGQARINVDAARRSVAQAATRAWESYQSSVASLKSLEERVRASELALDGVKKEEQAGTRTVLDVLDSEQELLDARVSVVTAKRNQVVAAYQLLASMGMMSPSGLGLDLSRYQRGAKKTVEKVNKDETAAQNAENAGAAGKSGNDGANAANGTDARTAEPDNGAEDTSGTVAAERIKTL